MIQPFADRALAWWNQHGRKDLPWQHNRNTYRVWVSEIMLQQTQVTTVIPYFGRFMKRYPTLTDLAAADLDDVLSLWAGLGYYARCRNLHKAAVTCAEKHNNNLPDNISDLEELPGIGRSTAAAIISQALDEPHAILDGNVKRLLARHATVEGLPASAALVKTLWAEAKARLPNKRGADYTQAVMDLGATLCTARDPECGACPVSEDCIAYIKDRVNEFPNRKPAKRIPKRSTNMLIAQNSAGKILLERRPPAGIWGGLWCFPEFEVFQEITDSYDLQSTRQQQLPDIVHRFTHFELTISPVLANCVQRGQAVKSPDSQSWYTLEQALELGIPKPVKTILQSIGKMENE